MSCQYHAREEEKENIHWRLTVFPMDTTPPPGKA